MEIGPGHLGLDLGYFLKSPALAWGVSPKILKQATALFSMFFRCNRLNGCISRNRIVTDSLTFSNVFNSFQQFNSLAV